MQSIVLTASAFGMIRSTALVTIAERSFGRPENAHQVIAGIVQGLAADLDDLAVGEDDFRPQDMVAGHPVFQTVRPSGILAEISPDRGHFFARRIRLVEITVLGQHILQIQRHYTGLDDDPLILDIHVEDLIHLRQDDGDAALNGNTPPAQVRPRPPRDDANLVIMGKFDDLRHLFGGGGKNDAIGFGTDQRRIVFIEPEVHCGTQHIFLAHQPDQLTDHRTPFPS